MACSQILLPESSIYLFRLLGPRRTGWHRRSCHFASKLNSLRGTKPNFDAKIEVYIAPSKPLNSLLIARLCNGSSDECCALVAISHSCRMASARSAHRTPETNV